MHVRKPRIFVDGRVFDTEYQGTRTYIHNLYKIMDDIGDFEIFLASCNPENAAGFFPGSTSIRFVRYHTVSKLKRAFRELPEMMARYNIDAAHYQYVAPPRKNCVQIVTIHDLLFKDFPDEFGLAYKMVKGAAFYLSAKRADLVTTVSDYSKKAIVRHFSIPEENIHVVPNGVSHFFFEPYDKQKAAMEVREKFGFRDYLLYVSRIEPRKNQLDLLRAYLELELYRQGKCLVFVGKTSISVPQLREILNPLAEDIRNKIFFLEDILNEDLRLLYQAAELFVYPSKGEGFGIPPLEAGALGIPTICSNTTAMGDFTFFGDRHISPDVSALKTSITRALAERPSNLREISNTIRRRYGWEKAAFTMNELIWQKLGKLHRIYTTPARHPNDLLIS
ncbi:MAG: glycosyltransferase family 4 protein [Chitinophagaceae bacterium]|nr:glycosyltransferase family 4 protein [Chitinophagaceae bacterium]